MCVDCSNNFAGSVMTEPESNIPVKCPICKTETVVTETFERYLSEGNRNDYLSVIAMKAIDPEAECLVSCPFCPYFEIWQRQAEGHQFLYCQGGHVEKDTNAFIKCGRVSCVICKLEFVPPVGGGFAGELDPRGDGEGEEQDTTSFRFHLACPEQSAFLAAVSEATRLGAGMACPQCHLVGSKNDACTHMHCPQCETEFCYVCGGAEATLDKSRPGTIFRHNDDWRGNPSRCPLFLHELPEYDDRWPADGESQRVARLSEVRTLALMRAVLEIVGEDAFERLSNRFPQVRNCGITLDDIKTADVLLIRRGGFSDELEQEIAAAYVESVKAELRAAVARLGHTI